MPRPQILLVNPWIHDFAAYDLWARPMGLLTMGTMLRRMGWDPILLDLLDADGPEHARPRAKPFAHGKFARKSVPKPSILANVPRTYSRYGVDPDRIAPHIASVRRPAAILVTSLMTYWYPGVKEAIGLLRQLYEDVPLLLGGIYASLMPDHALTHCRPDEVVTGPAEIGLAHALYRVTGIGSATGDQPPDFEFSPALDLMSNVSFLPLMTSRGCPYRCSYCASEERFPFFVRRGVPAVVDEIEQATAKYHFKDIAIYDDAFLVDAPHHAVPILNAAADRFPGMRWHTPNGLHCSWIDRRVATAMKRAGFETIRLGLETGSDAFHLRTGRKTDRQTFLQAVTNLLEAGFSGRQIGVYLLVGLPGQTPDQIEDDVEVVLQAGALPKLAEYSPIPGTALWPEALRNSRFPLNEEPLFHNCTLLPAAEKGVDGKFLQRIRGQISEHLVLTPRPHIDT